MRSVVFLRFLGLALLTGLSACSGIEERPVETVEMSLPGETAEGNGDSNTADGMNSDSEGAADSAQDGSANTATGNDGSDNSAINGDSINEGGADATQLLEGDNSPGNNSNGDNAEQGNDAANEDRATDADAQPALPAPASVCPSGPFADSPLVANAVPQTVCSGMNFIEGAVWFADRDTLFFSDITFGGQGNQGLIYSFTPGGQCEEFIQNAGTNGLAIAPDGNLLGSRHGDKTISVFDLETKQASVLIDGFEGGAFNGPNDIVLRSDGSLYFTDPNYGLGGGQTPLPTRAYWRDPQGVLTVIDEGGNANGISLSPDESRLYLSHLGGGAQNVLVYDVDANGAPSNPTQFLNVGSDGMAVDCAGNLYITGNGVQIFDPSGTQIGTLNTPGAANVAFGGSDLRTLFVTAGATLFTVEMAIPGMPY